MKPLTDRQTDRQTYSPKKNHQSVDHACTCDAPNVRGTGDLREVTHLRFFFLTITFFLFLQSFILAQDTFSPFARGIQKYRQGDLDGAIIDFEIGLTQEPGNEKVKQYFLNCLTGIAHRYVDKKDYVKALPYAQRAYELNPEDEEIKELYETLKKETNLHPEKEVKKEITPLEEKKKETKAAEVSQPAGEKKVKVVKEEKKEMASPKEVKPVEQKPPVMSAPAPAVVPQRPPVVTQPPVAVTPPPVEKKTEVAKVTTRKSLDDAGRLRIFQVLQKYRQSNYKETFAEFENLWNEYNDPNLKRTFVECLVGAATKLTEQKNYPDAFTYVKRAYELNPNDTAAERLYRNLKERPEIQGVITPKR